MSRPRTHLHGTLAGLCGTLCWSFDGLLFRIVATDGWQALFWRMASTTLVLGAIFLAKEGYAALHGFRLIGIPGFAIGILLATANALFIFSLSLTTVANTLFLFASVPIFTALLGFWFLHEPLRLRTAVAIVVGFGAIAMIFADGLRRGSIIGDLLAIATAVVFAGNVTVARASPQVPFVPPLIVAGALATLVAAMLSNPLAVGGRDLALLIASGAVQQTAGVLLFQWAARVLPAAEAGLLTFVETVFGPLWVWLAVDERPSIVALLGGSAIVATLAIHSWLVLKEERRAQPAGPASGHL